MSISINTLSSQTLKVSHAARSLNSAKRQEIGIHAIGGHTPISHVADRYSVSRKFVYQQKEKALDGIAQAFNPPTSKDGEKILFYIPVTKKWLIQNSSIARAYFYMPSILSRRYRILSRHTRLRYFQRDYS
jgi:hypothetical protein